MTTEAKVTKRSSLSPVWFIPLLALALAGWLAFKSWQETGPIIKIEFSEASGIEVGKTRIRYRDVAVGVVKSIRLSDDFKRVQVTAELDAHVAPLIDDRSNFWVVQPQVSVSGVSGIETLLSGVYIEMDQAGEGQGLSQSSFVALEEPPSVRSYDRGSSYVLTADTLGSLGVGSPVYYRDIPVGKVTGYKLMTASNNVQIRVFVQAPYDELVHEASRFWNVSGLEASFGLDGLELNMASLSSLISGGVEFSTPPSVREGSPRAKPGRNFHLFASEKALEEDALTLEFPFQLHFEGSVRGLKEGAPVEYLGLQVGQVRDIRLSGRESNIVEVLIAIQPERLQGGDSVSRDDVMSSMAGMVAGGMRAQLKSGSLIGGALYVDLVPESGEPYELDVEASVPVLPTGEGQYQQIARQMTDILDRVQALPLEDMGRDLKASLSNLRVMTADLQKARLGDNAGAVLTNLRKATDGLDDTTRQLERTLKAVDQTVAPDSALSHSLISAMDELSGAAKSVKLLTDELQRYPDALLRGRAEQE